MRYLLIILVSLILISCSERDYYNLSIKGIPNVKVTVNGEPAKDNHYINDFLHKGNNTIVINGHSENWYGFVLYSKTGIEDRNPKKYFEKDEEISKPINFSYDLKVAESDKKNWTKADTINKLTIKDKEQIFDIISTLQNEFQKNDIDYSTLEKVPNLPWYEDKAKIAQARKSFESLLFQISKYDDLTLKKAAQNEMLFRHGKKLVLVTALNKDLLYLGHSDNYQSKKGEWVFSLSFPELYFARFKGIWKVIYLI